MAIKSELILTKVSLLLWMSLKIELIISITSTRRAPLRALVKSMETYIWFMNWKLAKNDKQKYIYIITYCV